uniref:Uncharacterized protein n=1 Tax=Oryzias sinensis TaxID=183150 RepID=A0A8C7Y6A0_9TELE
FVWNHWTLCLTAVGHYLTKTGFCWRTPTQETVPYFYFTFCFPPACAERSRAETHIPPKLKRKSV